MWHLSKDLKKARDQAVQLPGERGFQTEETASAKGPEAET